MFFLKDKPLLKKLIVLFYPYKKRVAGIFALMLLSAGIHMLLPSLSKTVMDNGLLARDFSLVIQFSLLILGLFLLDSGLNMLETILRVRISTMLPYELEKKALDHAMKLPISYYSRNNVTQMMSTVSSDVDKMAMIADRSVFLIVTEFFRIIGGILGLIVIDWRLTLVVLAIIPIKYQIVKILAEKREKMFEQFMAQRKTYAAWYGDRLCGVKEIKLFGAGRKIFAEFMRKKRELIHVEARMDIVDQLNFILESAIFRILITLLYIIGAYLIFFQESLTIGGLFAFISYSIYVTDPIGVILEIGYAFSSILPSARRYFAFFKENEIEVSSQAGCTPPLKKEIKGRLVFKDLFFSYNGQGPVLKGLDLSIEPGEKVAILGPNGSGKTSLFRLITRLYSPDRGCISLDGIPIESIPLDLYRMLFAVVSQNSYLFHSSVKENIALKKKCSPDRIKLAAQYALADGFIDALPHGYDTVIGNNGASLSGGQRQKIALARAILKGFNAKIVLLDEVSAAFDMASEEKLRHFLRHSFLKDKTTLLITHREKILSAVDRIILLEEGKMIGSGNHQELLSNHSLYQSLIKEPTDG